MKTITDERRVQVHDFVHKELTEMRKKFAAEFPELKKEDFNYLVGLYVNRGN